MDKKQLIDELEYKAVRSSGAGGQHVNKVSSKVILSFNLDRSQGLTEKEKSRLRIKLGNRLSQENVLLLQCDEARSQHRNKALVTKRFFEVLKKGLQVPKTRKSTKPTKSSIAKRLKSKKLKAEKKYLRKKPPID